MSISKSIANGYARKNSEVADKFAGVMYMAADKILLLRRSIGSRNNPGVWAFPGGHLDANETPAQAARRESIEEIGHTPGNLDVIGRDDNGFTLFGSEGNEFIPTLNDEHDAYLWADETNLPSPIHPKIADCLKTQIMDSARQIDSNGFITIEENPIIREGVFPYRGSMLDPHGVHADIDPNGIYDVYRPAEELQKEEALESFKMLPFIDEHTMLGPSEDGLLPAEKKGVQGSTGETVAFRDGVVYSKLRIFSEAVRNLIKNGKKELSLGYRCRFERQSGAFAGKSYDFIQRSLTGNHLALVDKGRNNVAVLDGNIIFDHLDINLEEKRMPTLEELSAKIDAMDRAMKTLTADDAKLKTALDESEAEKKKDAEDEDSEDPKEKKKDAEDEGDGDKKDKKDAEDESEEDKKKDKDAMDSALKKIDAMDAEIKDLRKSGIKSLVSEVSKRNALAQRLSHIVGAFDHEDKTLSEVAAYGVEKLGLTNIPKGHEQTALDSYFHNRPANDASLSYAMDSSASASGVDAYLNKKA